jgi:SAM-dependent methyltransferase
MLKRLAKVGWIAEGIEWDESAAERARQRTGAKVWAGDFRNIDIPNARYKLIFLSHVFEHLYEPLEALGRFYELLDDGGKLVMFWPNCDSSDAKWFKEFWFHWDAPRHLIFPTSEIVRTRAGKIGFASCTIRSNAERWVWQNSKAYSLGVRPNESLPNLNTKELLGYRCQRVRLRQGAIVGSEISATLQKH